MKIPKLTGPLVKSIRTFEGWIVIGGTALLVVGSSIEPSQLPPELAAKLGAALGALHVVGLHAKKCVALLKGVGINLEPIVPTGSAAAEVPKAEELATTLLPHLLKALQHPGVSAGEGIVQQLVSDAEEFATQPAALQPSGAAGANGHPSVAPTAAAAAPSPAPSPPPPAPARPAASPPPPAPAAATQAPTS